MKHRFNFLKKMILLGSLGICSVLLGFPQKALAFLDKKAPEITSSVWINTEPLSSKALQGKVALIEFWTFGCYNCRNVEPKIKEWHQRYAEQGLVVIGVHSPEFSHEKDLNAVKSYVSENQLQHAIVLDNDFVNWKRFNNRYWPAIYLIDTKGIIRYVHIGEGSYAKTEKMIQTLLAEK
jgi:thiol-disulfide isomerase/thioredoxin